MKKFFILGLLLSFLFVGLSPGGVTTQNEKIKSETVVDLINIDFDAFVMNVYFQYYEKQNVENSVIIKDAFLNYGIVDNKAKHRLKKGRAEDYSIALTYQHSNPNIVLKLNQRFDYSINKLLKQS